MSEPWVPLPPKGPVYEERTVPLCPICKGLARRDLRDTLAGKQHGPWRCDLHGEVLPEWETLEIPAYYRDEEEDAYELNDPKHPTFHDRMADVADLRE